jgi:hypothetical protein
MTLSSCTRNLFTAATALALASTVAVPALAQNYGAGDTKTTKVGCTSPDPYADFEQVYTEDGRLAAYKVLAQSDACQVLEQPTNVKLQEPVASFDFGWGTGQVWRVTRVNKNADVPQEMFIRIRE